MEESFRKTVTNRKLCFPPEITRKRAILIHCIRHILKSVSEAVKVPKNVSHSLHSGTIKTNLAL